jgi:signal transduction histidine kinase
VRDEGPGIADGELDRIFEPFYSTKLLGRGVGLALVLSTARALGGGVCVQTGPTGTTIRICLSMADAA